MKIMLIALVLFLVPGCATTGASQMSADQLKAVAADKNFSAVCSTILGPWGTGKFVYVNVDRTVVVNGAISVDPNCVVTMSNEATIKPVPAVPPVPVVAK